MDAQVTSAIRNRLPFSEAGTAPQSVFRNKAESRIPSHTPAAGKSSSTFAAMVSARISATAANRDQRTRLPGVGSLWMGL